MTLKNLQINLYTIFVFISMQPFFIWDKEWVFILVASMFVFTCFLTRVNTLLNNKVYFFISFSAIFFIYLMIPFRQFDSFTPKHILFMSMLLLGIFWLNKEIITVWKKLRIIFLVVVVLSLLSTFLFYLQMPFPNYELNQDFRAKSTDIYKIYYGMIYLNTQLYNISGISILRNIGWFGEPGHFGVYLCILLAAEENPFKGRVNKILILGIISTLSAAAYLIIFLIFFIKADKIKFLIKLLLLAPVLFLLFYYTDIFTILDFVLSKFEDGDEILESRANLNTSILYETTMEVVFGLGNGVLEYYNMFSSDLRAFLLKYGYFSIVLFLLAIAPIFWQLVKINKIKNLCVFLLIILALAVHRSWMLDTFYLWFFMLVVLVNSFSIEYKGISNVE